MLSQKTAIEVDYTNQQEVIDYAKQVVRSTGHRSVCVVQHPSKQFAVLLNLPKPEKGLVVVWQNSIGD